MSAWCHTYIQDSSILPSWLVGCIWCIFHGSWHLLTLSSFPLRNSAWQGDCWLTFQNEFTISTRNYFLLTVWFIIFFLQDFIACGYWWLGRRNMTMVYKVMMALRRCFVLEQLIKTVSKRELVVYENYLKKLGQAPRVMTHKILEKDIAA